jgi:hypothetical protein
MSDRYELKLVPTLILSPSDAPIIRKETAEGWAFIGTTSLPVTGYMFWRERAMNKKIKTPLTEIAGVINVAVKDGWQVEAILPMPWTKHDSDPTVSVFFCRGMRDAVMQEAAEEATPKPAKPADTSDSAPRKRVVGMSPHLAAPYGKSELGDPEVDTLVEFMVYDGAGRTIVPVNVQKRLLKALLELRRYRAGLLP